MAPSPSAPETSPGAETKVAATEEEEAAAADKGKRKKERKLAPIDASATAPAAAQVPCKEEHQAPQGEGEESGFGAMVAFQADPHTLAAEEQGSGRDGPRCPGPQRNFLDVAVALHAWRRQLHMHCAYYRYAKTWVPPPMPTRGAPAAAGAAAESAQKIGDGETGLPTLCGKDLAKKLLLSHRNCRVAEPFTTSQAREWLKKKKGMGEEHKKAQSVIDITSELCESGLLVRVKDKKDGQGAEAGAPESPVKPETIEAKAEPGAAPEEPEISGAPGKAKAKKQKGTSGKAAGPSSAAQAVDGSKSGAGKRKSTAGGGHLVYSYKKRPLAELMDDATAAAERIRLQVMKSCFEA